MKPPAERLKSMLWKKVIACFTMLINYRKTTINHMIIFNDSVSKFYQWSIRGFCRGISVFLVSALAKKKNAEAVKFLEILKKIYLQE